MFHIYIDEVPELVALPAAVARQTVAEAEAFRSAKRIVVEGVDLPVRPLAGGRGVMILKGFVGKKVSEKNRMNFQKDLNLLLFKQKKYGANHSSDALPAKISNTALQDQDAIAKGKGVQRGKIWRQCTKTSNRYSTGKIMQ